MNNYTGSPGTFRRLVRWTSTPPQVYVVYVLALLVVWYISFYAGTLNPRKAPTSLAPAPPGAAPRN